MIKTSPNQRVVSITRDMPKGSKKPYMCAYCESIEAAARNLTPVAFKLYLYFISNQSNYREAFSTANFAQTYGCDVKSAKTAFHTLEEKGYLVLDEGTKSRYTFYEKPQEVTPAIVLPSSLAKKVQRKQFTDGETGEITYLTLDELINLFKAEGLDEAEAIRLWEEN